MKRCRGPRSVLAAATVLLAAVGAATPTLAQKLTLQLESRDAHADLPFVLVLTAEGFDEAPAPEAPELEIQGCSVRPLGTRCPTMISSGVPRVY